MTSVAHSIGIRSHGIAGATLAILDLACARIFSLMRLGFPHFVDEADTGAITAKMHHFAIARVATELSIRAERLRTKPHSQSETEALCKLN